MSPLSQSSTILPGLSTTIEPSAISTAALPIASLSSITDQIKALEGAPPPASDLSQEVTGTSQVIKMVEEETKTIVDIVNSEKSDRVDLIKSEKPSEVSSKSAVSAYEAAVKEEEIKLFERANKEIAKRTYHVVKSVKEKMEEYWVGNKDFLASALRKLERTSNMLQFLNVPRKEEQRDNLMEEYEFGLVKGGTKSDVLTLFSLTNDGNLPFEYTVLASKTDFMKPPQQESMNSEDSINYFFVFPLIGRIEPGNAFELSAHFIADASGFYRQRFDIMCGDDLIRSFSLKSRVGNPNIVCDPSVLDFGLIARTKQDSRPFLISNIGTYRDTWTLELDEDIKEDEISRKPSFSMDSQEGTLEPNESKTVQVTFAPSIEGNYSGRIRLLWSKEPRLLSLIGVGGGSKFSLKFSPGPDELFHGLDWGVAVVGNVYTKQFTLFNSGNITGFADFIYTNRPSLFQFDVERNENGLVKVECNETVLVSVTFKPQAVETLKDAVQVTQINGKSTPLPFKFKAGTCSWKVEGELNFLNMKYGLTEERTLTLSNDGTLDIPISYKIMADFNSSKCWDVSCKPVWTQGKLLKANQSIKITVSVSPEVVSVFGATLTLTTDLGNGPVEKSFSFKFQTFKEEFAIDNDSDASVGRIAVGIHADITRNLINYGNKSIKWRGNIKSEMNGCVLSIGDNPWTFIGSAEGQVSQGNSQEIGLRYTAPNREFNDWIEATITIEKCDVSFFKFFIL